MWKRISDIIISLIGLVITSPLIILAMVAIWLYDFHAPLYISKRVGQNGVLFKMVKLRSMIKDADKYKVDSTSSNDPRLTPVGKIIRNYKLDELLQLWNVITGDMSLVGPRPNVLREVELYTSIERKLLNVKPGITDISSIVFSDLNEILSHSQNPNLDYNQLVRPWKSRLGLLYVTNRSFGLDIKLIYLTCLALISRNKALEGIKAILIDLKADDILVEIATRRKKLMPFPPPGANEIVMSRETPMLVISQK